MNLPRLLVLAGLGLVLLGLIWLAAERLGLRPGHMPGDIVVRRERSVFYFPLATCLLLSLLLSLVAWASRLWWQ